MKAEFLSKIADQVVQDGEVSHNSWKLCLDYDNDTVQIWSPTGEGREASISYLKEAVEEFCKEAQMALPGGGPVAEMPVSTENEMGLQVEEDGLSGLPQPDMNKEEMISALNQKLHAEFEKSKGASRKVSRKEKKSLVKDTFAEDNSVQKLYDYYRNNKVSEILIKDIADEDKWVARFGMAKEESAPPGMEDMVLKLKKDKEVDNPYAVAWDAYNKKQSNDKKEAGPRLKETWGGDGGYTRDLEAEDAQSLYHMVRSFSTEEDYDWSKSLPVHDQQTEIENMTNQDSHGKLAVDKATKEYYTDYYGDFGKELTRDDMKKRDEGKKEKKEKKVDKEEKGEKEDKKEAQMLPTGATSAPKPPAAPPAGPSGSVPPAGGPKPPTVPGMTSSPLAGPSPASKSGDDALSGLGWTPEEISLMDDKDKQNIVKDQINKPGTKNKPVPGQEKPSPSAPPPPSGTLMGPGMPSAPGGAPGGAPKPPAPTPDMGKAGRAIMAKLVFKRAQQALQTAIEEPLQAPAVPPGQAPRPEIDENFVPNSGGDPSSKALQILSEVQQMPVEAGDAQQIPTERFKILQERLLKETGMTMDELKQVYGDPKMNVLNLLR